MKFDVVIGNPPYQAPRDINKKEGKGKVLWHTFVTNAIKKWSTENGIITFITPSGWRNYTGDYTITRDIMLNGNRMLFLNIYSPKESNKLFNVIIRVDAYCILKSSNGLTKIRCDDGRMIEQDLSTLSFIPNRNFELFNSLIAKDGEERVEIISDYSYDIRKKWRDGLNHLHYYMSDKQTEIFKYPVLSTLRVNDNHLVWWSSRNDKGHFGIPKVLFGRVGDVITTDIDGIYAIGSDIRGIVDDKDNIPIIESVIKSKKFRAFMKSSILITSGRTEWCNRDALRLFRKDFWRTFI